MAGVRATVYLGNFNERPDAAGREWSLRAVMIIIVRTAWMLW